MSLVVPFGTSGIVQVDRPLVLVSFVPRRSEDPLLLVPLVPLRPLPFNHSRNRNLVLRKSSFGIPASIEGWT